MADLEQTQETPKATPKAARKAAPKEAPVIILEETQKHALIQGVNGTGTHLCYPFRAPVTADLVEGLRAAGCLTPDSLELTEVARVIRHGLLG